MNCPELTNGFYTKEELLDNDFSQKPERQADLNDLLKEDTSDSIDTDAVIIGDAEEV